MADNVRSEKGTVARVTSAEPKWTPGTVPKMNSRVLVELHGHAHRYVVRVAPGPDGPVLTELFITSDDGAPIDYAAIKSVSVRRLAYAAMQWLSSGGGQFVGPGELTTRTRPEKADTARQHRRADDELLTDVAALVEHAVSHGLQVQTYVGQRMNASTATVDRWIRKAKQDGFLPDKPLPRRKKGGVNDMPK